MCIRDSPASVRSGAGPPPACDCSGAAVVGRKVVDDLPRSGVRIDFDFRSVRARLGVRNVELQVQDGPDSGHADICQKRRE